jgi:ribosome biogenesis GTPase
VERIAAGVPVHAISARTGQGLAALAPYLGVRRTVGALGSSGVGKSTLINGLLGREAQATGAVRASDDQGRHTTTHRELFMLPGGAMIIDTPGMRELQLWDIDQGLDTAFDDVQAVAATCKFRDCRHGSEPGCAVRAAVDRKELTADRVASYAKLARELEALHTRQDERAVLEHKRSDKIGKAGKSIKDRE